MNKLLLNAALCGLLFVSCNKQDHVSAVSPTTSQDSYKGPVKVIAMGKYSYVSEKDPCERRDGDCIRLKEVVVRPSRRIDIIDAATAGPGAVGDLFSSVAFAEICSELPADLSAKLQSGTYAIRMGYNGADAFNFIAGSGSVSESDFEFAVEMKVSE